MTGVGYAGFLTSNKVFSGSSNSHKRVRRESFFSPEPAYVLMLEGGVSVRFKQPEAIRRTKIEDGYICLEFEQLGVYAAGRTIAEAKCSFWEDLDFMWRSYVESDDRDLTLDALNLRNKLLDYLVEV